MLSLLPPYAALTYLNKFYAWCVTTYVPVFFSALSRTTETRLVREVKNTEFLGFTRVFCS